MCGRFSLAVSEKKLQRELPFVELGANVKPSYNIAPTQHAYVVTNEAPPVLQYLTWGLVPAWSKDVKGAYRMINARAESVAEKPAYARALASRRALVPAGTRPLTTAVPGRVSRRRPNGSIRPRASG